MVGSIVSDLFRGADADRRFNGHHLLRLFRKWHLPIAVSKVQIGEADASGDVLKLGFQVRYRQLDWNGPCVRTAEVHGEARLRVPRVGNSKRGLVHLALGFF